MTGADRYGRTSFAKIRAAFNDLRAGVRAGDFDAAEEALDRYEPWADAVFDRNFTGGNTMDGLTEHERRADIEAEEARMTREALDGVVCAQEQSDDPADMTRPGIPTMTAEAGLSLAQTIRVRIAFGGGLRLDLGREDAITLLRIIERNEQVMQQCEQLEEAAVKLRRANERAEVMLADLRAAREAVGGDIGPVWWFGAIIASAISIVI